MANPSHDEVVELLLEPAKDLGSAIGGHVVGDQEAVAKVRNVEERLAHEPILVPDERDADDLH